MNNLSNNQTEGNAPVENINERSIAKLRKELSEHPEDELRLKQQMLLFMHVTDKKEETIDLAFEVLAKDTEGKYKCDCYLVLARVYARKKENDKAIDYYRKTITADPTHEQAIMEFASFYEDQFNYDAAIAIYNTLDDETYKEMQEYKYRSKGFCYYKKREFEKALVCYQTALDRFGEEKDAALYENIGGCYFNMNNFQEASSRFKKALEINPQSAVAHYGLGLCYQHTDDVYRALHHYFEALKLKPDYIDAYNNIAAITVNEDGDYKAGIDMLKKAIDNCPDKNSLTIIYLNLSRVYRSLTEFALADYYHAEYMKSVGFDVLFEEEDDEDE